MCMLYYVYVLRDPQYCKTLRTGATVLDIFILYKYSCTVYRVNNRSWIHEGMRAIAKICRGDTVGLYMINHTVHVRKNSDDVRHSYYRPNTQWVVYAYDYNWTDIRQQNTTGQTDGQTDREKLHVGVGG